MKNKPLYEIKHISNLKDMLNQSSKLFGLNTAFLIKNKNQEEYIPILYSQFKKDVDSLGTALMDLGLNGARIALISENRYEWAVSYLAVVNGTGVVVPLDKDLPENEIQSLIERSGASGIIFSGKFGDSIKKIAEENKSLKVLIGMDRNEESENILPFYELIIKGQRLINDGDKNFLNAKIDNEGMSMMLFTSGTTDKSKAVMLSHRNICADIMDMSKVVFYSEEDTLLSVLPLHHTYECTCGFLAPISKGATIVYCEGLRHIVKNLKETKTTIMLSVPLIFESIYKHIWEQAGKKRGLVLKMKLAMAVSNFLRKVFGINMTQKLFKRIHDTFGGHLRLFISGAAAIDPKVAKGFRSLGIHFIQGYGLTECSPIPILNMDTYFKDASIGLPMPSFEAKIQGASADGIGEIVVKGPSVMLGYYENEEATAEVLKDGWLYTGDFGYIDKDGFVYITGRKKNVIVTKNGKNIFPEELEMLLNRSPNIKESMVWGKPDKDGDMIICATIVSNKEYIAARYPKQNTDEFVYSLIKQDIKALNKKVPLYKHIKEFTIRDEEFQKTTTKKIKRYLELVNNFIHKI